MIKKKTTKIAVSVIVLNYNTEDLLKKCLESLELSLKKSGLSSEVMVVDNDSTDSSVEMVKENFKDLTLIENKVNLGFAAGNNAAIPKTSGRYVLFLNPDTIVCQDTIPEIVKFMDQNPTAAIGTCLVELSSGKIDPDSHRGFPTPWVSFCYFIGLSKLFPKSRLFNKYHLGFLDFTKAQEIDACVGAFMMVRRKAAEEVGWWDEDYFFYGEDIDWCYRFKKKGWKILYYPFVKITHLKGASSGIRKETEQLSKATLENRRRIARASVAAMEIFYRKHLWSKYNFLLNFLVIISLRFLTYLRVRRYRY